MFESTAVSGIWPQRFLPPEGTTPRRRGVSNLGAPSPFFCRRDTTKCGQRLLRETCCVPRQLLYVVQIRGGDCPVIPESHAVLAVKAVRAALRAVLRESAAPSPDGCAAACPSSRTGNPAREMETDMENE